MEPTIFNMLRPLRMNLSSWESSMEPLCSSSTLKIAFQAQNINLPHTRGTWLTDQNKIEVQAWNMNSPTEIGGQNPGDRP